MICPKCGYKFKSPGQVKGGSVSSPAKKQAAKKREAEKRRGKMMIIPTVGRVVWFYKYVPSQGHKGPLAAHVAFVHSDSMVNLMVIDENGNPRSETSVCLRQDNSEVPQSNYCEWMPYQKGQAAKTEALEAKISGDK